MSRSIRSVRLGVCHALLGTLLLGLPGSAKAWIEPPRDYPDVKIASAPAWGDAVAFNPANPKQLAVGIVSGATCYVRFSKNGGITWGSLVKLPQLPEAECWSDSPAVAYERTGRVLYAAYVYRKPADYYSSYGLVVSSSSDQGATWSPPTMALPETQSDPWVGDYPFYVTPQIATAPDGPSLYLTIQLLGYHDNSIGFASSADGGLSWTPMTWITDVEIPSAPRLAAGPHGTVLVAYTGYHYCQDRSGECHVVSVARSTDGGASFIGGLADEIETDFYGDDRFRWADIKIGARGTAHIVYHRVIDGSDAAILYKFALPPYETWSARPARLDDGTSEAKLPRLAVGTCGDTSVLHVTWVQSANGREEMLYTRKLTQPQDHWVDPITVSHTARIVQASGLAAIGAHAFSVLSYWGDAPVFGSRVASGVTCQR